MVMFRISNPATPVRFRMPAPMRDDFLGKFVMVIEGPNKGAFGFVKFWRPKRKTFAIKLLERYTYNNKSYPKFIDASVSQIKTTDPRVLTFS